MDCLSVGILVADHLCSPIPHVPREGELVLAEALPLTIGGCAANAAVDLARLGVATSVVGAVGDDVFGRFIAQELSRQGVDTTGLRYLSDVPTSGTLILNVEREDRRFIHAVGANARFRASDIDPALVRHAKVLYVGGYLLMPALDPQELASRFCEARRAGVKTVLDVVLPGPQVDLARLTAVLADTDVFLPNEDEARLLCGRTDPVEQARYFHDAGAKTVVITCGGSGTIVWSDTLRVRASVYRVPFVGGTGAGDAFDAGYIAGLLAGGGPVDCLRWGSALGASCVRGVGATESVFNRQELLDFLDGNELQIENL